MAFDPDKLARIIANALKDAVGDVDPTKTPTVDVGGTTKRVSDLDLKNLQEYLEKQKQLNKEIEDNIDIAKKYAKETIDAEQIINEMNEERIRQLRQQFRQNQLTLIELRKQYDLIKDKNSEEGKELQKKIKALEEVVNLQARELENDEKLRKNKENIKSITGEIFQTLKNIGLEQEKHIIQISKLTGGYADIFGTMREASRISYANTLGLGITAQQTNQAMTELATGFKNLKSNTADGIASMTIATAQLEKVGVSGTSAAKGFDTLVNAMGKTPQQAAKIEQSFVQMAAKNKLALSTISEAFAANSDRFVGYGEKMNKVLEGLAYQSLQTGIEVNKLINIAQGFDTFEDASRKVGSLNSLLGGDYLNSVEMLTASDEDRIRLIRESVAASGLQWESMNRFQKMAVANAAGIKDLNEAAKMFGKQNAENIKQQAEQAEVQKTLEQQAEQMSTMFDKLKSSFNGLMIAIDPFLELAMTLVGVFGKILNTIVTGGGMFDSFGRQVMAVIVSVGLGIAFFAGKNVLLGGSFGFVGRMAQAAMQQINAFAAAARSAPSTVGGGASPASPGSLTTGVNAGKMIESAAAMLLFAGALFVLAKALQEFSDPSITGGGIGIAIGSIGAIVGISYLLQRAAPNITSGSILIAIIAGSLLLLGAALQMFSKVDWKLVAGIGVIILGLGLAIAGFGLAVSGPQGALLAIGIAVLIGIAGALYILGKAIELVVDSLSKASPAFTNLTNSLIKLFQIKDLKQNFSDLKTFFSDLSDINIEPINNLANAIAILATNLEILASLSAVDLATVKGKAEMAVQYTESTKNMATYAANQQAAVADLGRNTGGITTSTTTNMVPVQVYIGKDKILDILSKDFENIAADKSTQLLEAVGIETKSLPDFGVFRRTVAQPTGK
jgi:hypothetical protein